MILKALIIIGVSLSFSIPVLLSYTGMNETGFVRVVYLLTAFFSCLVPFFLGMKVKTDWDLEEREKQRQRLLESQEW